jgi:hypothetical protein
MARWKKASFWSFEGLEKWSVKMSFDMTSANSIKPNQGQFYHIINIFEKNCKNFCYFWLQMMLYIFQTLITFFKGVLFVPMPLALFFTTQIMHFKSNKHNTIAMFFQKKHTPWRNSNPGLQSLRLMRCPLRHADGEKHWISFIYEKIAIFPLKIGQNRRKQRSRRWPP